MDGEPGEYTEQQRAEALDLYRGYGAGQAGATTWIARSTISSWGRRRGVHRKGQEPKRPRPSARVDGHGANAEPASTASSKRCSTITSTGPARRAPRPRARAP